MSKFQEMILKESVNSKQEEAIAKLNLKDYKVKNVSGGVKVYGKDQSDKEVSYFIDDEGKAGDEE